MTASHGFTVGEVVEVHAFGHWYRGEVVKVTAKRVTVRYTTGPGRTREKSVQNPHRADFDPDRQSWCAVPDGVLVRHLS